LAKTAARLGLCNKGEIGHYYDVHKVSNMRHEMTILAYEMNGAPVSSARRTIYGCAAKMSSGSRW
jgi:DMSO/TMAO reductase YedYZ molybdopterin-dependent catalytic subunit